MMSLNRYRLKHMAKNDHHGAKRAQPLLERPDRLIGVILIGNNFVNILASAIATLIAIRLWGDKGIAIATGMLTLVILIFAEVTPKTLAALKPERVAFPASIILQPLLIILHPMVWLVNIISNSMLALIGVKANDLADHSLSQEELHTILNEAGALIPGRHKSMLLSILELEGVTVDDIMIPKHDVLGVDLDDETSDIIHTLRLSQHTRLPVFKGSVNKPVGILHIRKIIRLLLQEDLTKSDILQLSDAPYFIPEGTPLHTQLINFQKEKRRFGFVVDEYGDILGIATLEDILEEIVGEFTTDMLNTSQDIHPQKDGSYIIDGGTNIREINKALNWKLPTHGPKTLSGLITEHLESIPETVLCIRIGNYRMEIKQIKDNLIKTALITPGYLPSRPVPRHHGEGP